MFGYIMIDKPELKVKEFYRYKAYYCGLCRTLKEQYGFSGRMTLTYDMTFLVLFLTSLYECENKEITSRCPVHPIKKIPMLQNEMTEYAAKMNILLTYYKLEDDWQDDKSLKGICGVRLFHKRAKKAAAEYPRQTDVMKKQLEELHKYEIAGETDLDRVAGCFGKLMEELFVYKKDYWEPTLREFGFFLGKFIYILDAYDDLEEDKKSGSYNPLLTVEKRYGDKKEAFEQDVQQILTMMISNAAAAFERLPCIEDAEIIKNILYAGVWARYNKIQKEKQERNSKNDK